MTKDEILDTLEDNRERLLDAIEGLSDQALLESGVVGDWSVKDLLAHISAWEAELVKLLWQARQGQQPTGIYFRGIPIDEINATWIEASKSRSYDRVMDDFISVRKQTIRQLEHFTDKDLSDPERYNWAKGHPLWEWITENSFGHEAEHTAEILAWRARRGL